MSRRTAAALLCLSLLGPLTLALAAPASAQTAQSALEARIREISFDSEGQTRVVVSLAGTGLTGTLAAGNFQVTEGGAPVGDVTVEELFSSKSPVVAVALVLDVSDSTRGAPLAAAKTAARDFVNGLPSIVRVALVSFGTTARLVQDFTTDRPSILSAIDSLQTGGKTSLYDGVVLAADQLARQPDAQRNMVVFSDGDDSNSSAELVDAVNAVRSTETATTTVLLTTSKVDEGALRRIAGANRAGGYVKVEDQQQLVATFARIAQSLSSQYVLTYKRDDYDTKDLSISVTVNHAGFVASDQSVALNLRKKVAPPLPELKPDKPLIPAFGSSAGLYLGILAAFLGIALFLGMLFWQPASRGAERMLARRLRLYSRSERKKDRQLAEQPSAFGGSAMGRRAVELVEKLPTSKKFDESIQLQIDQAGWPLRTSEFVLIQIGALIGGFVIGAGLFGRLWLGVVLGVFAAFMPRVALLNRMQKRSSDFLAQLPETLQLLSGSLSAGYGFLQALDTVAKEAAPPTSTEFSRVLAEARLGSPVEDALDAMAERVGGEDFRWVVLAINIQRQVGGNLAQLLSTVAQTLREREQVRRQIKVLSAEGRLSAVILVALPFVLFGYLSVINPGYLGQLTGATVGKIAIVGALVLIGIGAVWMRKIIKIDV